MASGLVQLDGFGAGPALLVSTISDGVTAATIVLAMTTGLLVPKLIIDAIGRRVPARTAAMSVPTCR
jgi:hypothetical protein